MKKWHLKGYISQQQQVSEFQNPFISYPNLIPSCFWFPLYNQIFSLSLERFRNHHTFKSSSVCRIRKYIFIFPDFHYNQDYLKKKKKRRENWKHIGQFEHSFKYTCTKEMEKLCKKLMYFLEYMKGEKKNTSVFSALKKD